MHGLGDLWPLYPAIVVFVQPNKGVKIAPLKIVRLTISARLFNINECTSHLCDELLLPLQGHVITSGQLVNVPTVLLEVITKMRVNKGGKVGTEKNGQ